MQKLYTLVKQEGEKLSNKEKFIRLALQMMEVEFLEVELHVPLSEEEAKK